MARHRNVRTMNYEDEFYDEDEMYGHSVEDSYCISPATAAQFTFNRDREHDLSSYMEEGIPEEEDESDGETQPLNDSSGGRGSLKLSDVEEAQLNSCLEEIRNVLGETIPENIMAQTIVKHKFNIETALNELLSQQDAPKPQRKPRANRRNRSEDDSDFDEFLESLESQSPAKSNLFSDQTGHSGILKFGSPLLRSTYFGQQCRESKSGSNDFQGQKSQKSQQSDQDDKKAMSQQLLKHSDKRSIKQEVIENSTPQNAELISLKPSTQLNATRDSKIKCELSDQNKISLSDLTNLKIADAKLKVGSSALKASNSEKMENNSGLKAEKTGLVTSDLGKLSSLAAKHDSTEKKESSVGKPSLSSLVKQTESKLNTVSLKDLMIHHSESKPSPSGLSLKQLIQQDSGSKTGQNTLSLKDLVKQNSGQSTGNTLTNRQGDDETDEQKCSKDIKKSTEGLSALSLKDLVKQGSGSIQESLGISLSTLAKQSSETVSLRNLSLNTENKLTECLPSAHTQDSGHGDGMQKQVGRSNISLKDLARQDVKTVDSSKALSALLVSSKSGNTENRAQQADIVTNLENGNKKSLSDAIKGRSVKLGREEKRSTESENSQKQRNDQHKETVKHSSVELIIPTIDTSQNLELLSKPSVLAKILSIDSNKQQTSQTETFYKHTKFPRFSYSYQIRNVKVFSPVKIEHIIPFDFSTPSPDDIVKEKQKGAFTRTGERKISN